MAGEKYYIDGIFTKCCCVTTVSALDSHNLELACEKDFNVDKALWIEHC